MQEALWGFGGHVVYFLGDQCAFGASCGLWVGVWMRVFVWGFLRFGHVEVWFEAVCLCLYLLGHLLICVATRCLCRVVIEFERMMELAVLRR